MLGRDEDSDFFVIHQGYIQLVDKQYHAAERSKVLSEDKKLNRDSTGLNNLSSNISISLGAFFLADR